MDINNKRIIKNTLYLYIRMFITMLVSLYTSRKILELLGVQDLGIYNAVGGIVLILAALNATLSSGTVRFLTFELGKNNLEKLRKTFSTSFAIHSILAIVVLLLAETIGLWFLNNKMNIPSDRMYAAQWVFQFSILAGIASIMQVPFTATIVAHEKMSVYAYISIVDAALKLLIVYLLFSTNFDKLIIYSALIFVVNSVIILISILYCQKKYLESRIKFEFDKSIFKSILIFSGWNIFNASSQLIIVQGINILLNIFFGPAINAARGLSYQASNAINGLVGNLQVAFNPQITKLYATEKIENLYSLLYQNAKFAYLLLWLFCLPIILEINYLLAFWLKSPPLYMSIFCRLLLIYNLLLSIEKPFIMAMHATGKIKEISLYTGIIFILILPISYMLLRLNFPAETPFIIQIIFVPVCMAIELYYLKKRISIPLKQIAKKVFSPIIIISLLSLTITIIPYLLLESGVLRLAIVSCCATFSTIILTYFLGIGNEERLLLKSFVSRKYNSLFKN